MPSSTKQLIPKTVNPEIFQIKFEMKQKQQKKYYDRSSKSVENLIEGENIYVEREGKWKPAVVLSKADIPRRYNVKISERAEYRRNRRHLRKTNDQNLQSPLRLQSKKNEADTKEQTQLKETRVKDEQSICGTTLSPMKTRSGCIVSKPIQ